MNAVFPPRRSNRFGVGCLVVCVAVLAWVNLAMARDAAFLEPNSTVSNSTNGESIKVEPKSETDLGDSAQNLARRMTLFFVNQTNAPIKIEKTSINSDSNVTAEIANDDCSKQDILAPSSRCSIEVQLTPTAAGSWSAELLMTHNGAGRLTRAKISGRTISSGGSDKRDTGLFLSTKEVKPVDFGEVNLGEGKTVRTALMVNDSPTPITLYAIDVIEANNGLQHLDQGCAVDMELKPGESCPITLVWTPSDHTRISTDLIIRHSGQLGFAVIPIRGTVKADAVVADTGKDKEKDTDKTSSKAIAPPPSATELSHMTDKIPAVSASALSAASAGSNDTLHLIGTVGNRALIYKPDGTTAVVQVGDAVDYDTHTAKITKVGARDVTLTLDGKTRTLQLEAVQQLTDKARQGHASMPSYSGGGSINGAASSLAPANAAFAQPANQSGNIAATTSSPVGSGSSLAVAR